MKSTQQAPTPKTVSRENGRVILNVTEVARMFRCSTRTVRNWVKAGRIPHFRLPGGHIRFKREGLRKWMDEDGQ